LGKNDEFVVIRNLGSSHIEVLNILGNEQRAFTIHRDGSYSIISVDFKSVSSSCPQSIPGIGSMFSPADVELDWSKFVFADPPHGCSTPLNTQELRDQVAIVHRGNCSFYQKTQRLAKAGVKAVLVVNVLEPFNMFVMGFDGSGREVNLPVVMIQGSHERNIRSCLLESKEFSSVPRVRIRRERLFLSASGDGNSFVTGNFDDFIISGLGGWKARIHKDGSIHHLAIL
jgi:hypothetical protein